MELLLVQGLATALRDLMREHPEARTAVALEKLTRQKAVKVGKSTIDRATRGQVAIGVDALESIAIAFGMRPWQLLRRADPVAPPAKPGNRQNPAWVGHSAAHRELFAVVLSAGPDLPEEACKTLTALIRQLSPKPVTPDPSVMSAPVIEMAPETRAALKKAGEKAIFK